MFRSTSLREKLTWLLTVHPYCDHNIQSKVHLTYFGHVLLLSCLILHQSVKSLTLKMLNFLIWRSLQLTSESLSPLSSTVAQNATLRRSLYGNLKIVREMKEIDSGTWKVEVLKIEALRMNELGFVKVDLHWRTPRMCTVCTDQWLYCLFYTLILFSSGTLGRFLNSMNLMVLQPPPSPHPHLLSFALGLPGWLWLSALRATDYCDFL